jgi:hypothetical protein
MNEYSYTTLLIVLNILLIIANIVIQLLIAIEIRKILVENIDPPIRDNLVKYLLGTRK